MEKQSASSYIVIRQTRIVLDASGLSVKMFGLWHLVLDLFSTSLTTTFGPLIFELDCNYNIIYLKSQNC